MNLLEEKIEHYYTSGYNCSETLLRACNDTYQLQISEDDLRLMAGFGAGMFIGSTCGALVGSIAALSKMVCPTKAHDMIPTIRPLMVKLNQNFKAELGALDCAHVKPNHHSKEKGCLYTCLLAGKAFEKTLKEESIKADQ